MMAGSLWIVSGHSGLVLDQARGSGANGNLDHVIRLTAFHSDKEKSHHDVRAFNLSTAGDLGVKMRKPCSLAPGVLNENNLPNK